MELGHALELFDGVIWAGRQAGARNSAPQADVEMAGASPNDPWQRLTLRELDGVAQAFIHIAATDIYDELIPVVYCLCGARR